MSLSRKSLPYWKSAGDDRVPYRSWKSYRKSQVHAMLQRDSILNHIPMEDEAMKTRAESDNVIRTINGAVAIEPKAWAGTLRCENCGETMDLVSIEDGYSCRNEECILNLTNA